MRVNRCLNKLLTKVSYVRSGGQRLSGSRLTLPVLRTLYTASTSESRRSTI